ncbi:MAG: hypothetical protein M3145_01385 [Pseudomonadota bacterium]|nr:hypothetical protein [Pseudomonadota bacterium]
MQAFKSHLGVLTAALLMSGSAFAHDKSHHVAMKTELRQFGDLPHAAPSNPDEADVPLWGNLGTLSYAIATSKPLAQRYFDQGLMLAYGFNHAEARRSFQAAQRIDPDCAMCFWGEALVLGPNINAPMEDAAREPALAALGQARKLAGRASEREQALIEALAARYSADPSAERAALDQAYAAAMERVAARFPADLDIAVLYAEALMNLSPWDYWEAGGTKPKGRTADIVATLERVLAAHPDHPGAIHYYIHAVEASDRPQRAEPYADRLAKQKLGAGHLVHMPSHIYYRIGRYKDSLETNKAAVAADEAFFARVKAEGIYRGGYYPHNIHFLLASAQMAGDGETAVQAAGKLEKAVSDEIVRTVPWTQPIKAAPYFAHAQFSSPETVLALAAPTDEFPYVKAMWHYARGVAQAAAGNTAAAQAEAKAIAGLAEADFGSLVAGGVPAPDVLRLARHIVLARIAQAKGDLQAAIREFEAAAAIQATLAFFEPPFWYYPVRQSLGAVRLQAGEPEKAEQDFRASLKGTPNNGWALYGLMQVYEARRETGKAEEVARRLQKAWAGDRRLLDLKRL